jgi:hypothetical protein
MKQTRFTEAQTWSLHQTRGDSKSRAEETGLGRTSLQ